MKRKTSGNPKFEDFQEALELRRYQAVGLLELLWHFTADYAPDGNVGRFPNRRIARKLEWEGDPDELVRVLVETHWLDVNVVDPIAPREPARLFVHDWPEHCEDSVHRSLARARMLFADGTLPKTTRLQAPERPKVEADLAAKYPEHVRTQCAPPRPRPRPQPEETEQQTSTSGTSGERSTAPRAARGRKLANVDETHLEQERPLLALFDRAIDGGYVLQANAEGTLVPRPRNRATVIAFFTLARYSMRAPRIVNRAGYFVDCLAKGRWNGSAEDEAWALERLKVLEGKRPDVAEAMKQAVSTLPSSQDERSHADTCAHCGVALPCEQHDVRPGESLAQHWARLEKMKRDEHQAEQLELEGRAAHA